MHEMAIVQGIMNAAIPEAEKHGAKKILAIRLKIGVLSGVVPQCIQDYFQIAAQGTMAQEAKIEVEKIPIGIRCESCGYEGGIEQRKFRCPQCDSIEVKVVSGKEYFVESLEVE